MNHFGYLSQILAATRVTLSLAGVALVIGLTVGIMCAWLETLNWRLIRLPCQLVLAAIRGAPEILILFFVYFGLSQWLSRWLTISPFCAGATALGIIFAAYAAEVFRGAFFAIERGQVEAAMALGFKKQQIFYQIQLPQLWRHALPALGNLWLVLLKDTAIVTLIGLSDLMDKARLAAAATHQPFFYYGCAALIYLLITGISELLLHRYNTYLNHGAVT